MMPGYQPQHPNRDRDSRTEAAARWLDSRVHASLPAELNLRQVSSGKAQLRCRAADSIEQSG